MLPTQHGSLTFICLCSLENFAALDLLFYYRTVGLGFGFGFGTGTPSLFGGPHPAMYAGSDSDCSCAVETGGLHHSLHGMEETDGLPAGTDRHFGLG